MEIRKILVPVDFSEPSQRALDAAVSVAKHFGSELILFHCYPLPLPSPTRVPFDSITPESYVEAVRTAALARITQWRDKVVAQGIPAEARVCAGVPASEIAAIAEELGVDLIVVGTRGVGGLEHVLLGSVAERTIRIAPCPVLTIKA